jgi:hypothetical protein
LRRIKAAAAVAAACLFACAAPGASAPSASNPGGPVATPSPLSASQAADLRTRLDLLLGEQVFIVAKESAAAAAQTDAYPGYVSLLAANGSDLVDLLRLAFGNTSAAQFGVTWTQMNRDLVEYAVGLVTHKQSQADLSSADLVNVVEPALSKLVSSLTRLVSAQVTQSLTQQVMGAKLVADDAVAQNFPKLYTDLHAAYEQTSRLGDLLAAQIVKLFPDKFPGDPSAQAVTFRVSLNHLMQEHAYLATMATSAGIAGRNTEQAAATASLASNAASLGAAFSDQLGTATGNQLEHLWVTRDTALLEYAAGGAGAKQVLTQQFVTQFVGLTHVPQTLVGDQAAAAVAAIDDQRAKAFDKLAADDRTAATEMEPIADAMTAG